MTEQAAEKVANNNSDEEHLLMEISKIKKKLSFLWKKLERPSAIKLF